MAKTNYVTISEYIGSDEYSHRSAEVLRTVGLDDNYWGIRMRSHGESLMIEWYPSHSESWAESAAENYVMGIKDYIDDRD